MYWPKAILPVFESKDSRSTESAKLTETAVCDPGDQPYDLNRVFSDFLGRAVTRYTLYASLRGNPMDSGSGMGPGSGSGSSFLDNQNPKASFAKPYAGVQERAKIASGTFLLEKTSFLVAGLSPAPPGAYTAGNCPSPCELDTVHL